MNSTKTTVRETFTVFNLDVYPKTLEAAVAGITKYRGVELRTSSTQHTQQQIGVLPTTQAAHSAFIVTSGDEKHPGKGKSLKGKGPGTVPGTTATPQA